MRKLEPIERLNIRRPNMVKRGLTYSKQNLSHMLATTRNRTGPYVVGARDQNHHATHH